MDPTHEIVAFYRPDPDGDLVERINFQGSQQECDDNLEGILSGFKLNADNADEEVIIREII